MQKVEREKFAHDRMKKKRKNICTNWIYKPSNDVDIKFRNANTFKKARIRAAALITRARSFEQKNSTKKYDRIRRT